MTDTHRRIRAIIAAIACAAALASACGAGSAGAISLEPTPIVSGGPGWGVIETAYVRLMAEPSWTSDEVGSGRRGDIGRIKGRKRVSDGRDAGVWYRIETASGVGWVHQSGLTVYQRMEEAEKASGGAE